MKQEARLFPRKPFYLVRHGESFANKFEYPSGSMDTRLTRLGWAQARATAAVAARLTIKPGVIVASQLVRARETATLIHAHMECSLKTDRYLAEQHYGGYQGVSKHRIVAQHGHEIWWKAPQEGESLALFSSRVMGCMGRWLNRYDEIKKLFQQLDTDKDHRISFGEFEKGHELLIWWTPIELNRYR